MKFIKLESRGGNYLVVAENVAWLRTAENGQTNVGIIGGQPLLVVGSIEDVAAKILASVNGEEPPEVAEPAPALAAAVVAASSVEDEAEPLTVAQHSEQESDPEPAGISPESQPEPGPAATQAPPMAVEPVPAIPSIEPDPEPESAVVPEARPLHLQPKPVAAAGPRPATTGKPSLWERAIAPAASGLKIKAGSQRMMGMLE